MNAVEQAQAAKRELDRMLGGALSPDYMYVLGPEPITQGNPPQAMSLQTHGWGDWQEWYADARPWQENYTEIPYAELCAEEASDYIERACRKVCKPGTWDMVQGCVACFYGENW